MFEQWCESHYQPRLKEWHLQGQSAYLADNGLKNATGARIATNWAPPIVHIDVVNRLRLLKVPSDVADRIYGKLHIP